MLLLLFLFCEIRSGYIPQAHLKLQLLLLLPLLQVLELQVGAAVCTQLSRVHFYHLIALFCFCVSLFKIKNHKDGNLG